MVFALKDLELDFQCVLKDYLLKRICGSKNLRFSTSSNFDCVPDWRDKELIIAFVFCNKSH